MKKHCNRSLNRQHYEAPQVEVIEIECQGVLCDSAQSTSTGAGGGTTNMGMQGGYGW